jgi:hypothetical protein
MVGRSNRGGGIRERMVRRSPLSLRPDGLIGEAEGVTEEDGSMAGVAGAEGAAG